MERAQLAAGFFLIAHDEFSGQLRISTGLLGCGLVTAQLARLVIAGHLGLVDGRVVVADAEGADRDEIDAFVVAGIEQQSAAHSVRAWVDTLSDVLYELLGRRLTEGGVVRRERPRRMVLRRPDRFPAVDVLAATGPRKRLEEMLRHPRQMDLPGAFTAALLWTLGLDVLLDPELDRDAAGDLVEQVNELLPADLQSLLSGARAATAGMSLTIRR